MTNYLDVDIVTNGLSSIEQANLITEVELFLKDDNVSPETIISNFGSKNEHFRKLEIKHIIVGQSTTNETKQFDIANYKINWYVYALDTYGTTTQTECDQDGGVMTLATHLTLPSEELFALWENLYYDENIKGNLLSYAKTMMEFSQKGINPNIVGCNRVILLHGPPGTGKTSLCKALAQKLSIKLQHIYTTSILIEINSHSLFSRWFSESGKLVTNMFSKIKQICEDDKIFVCVLMDEIESLAHARSQCISGNEPSDAVRVVNAMLTQIDQIRKFPNVLMLATSNMTEAIDLAFVDRADIKQFLDLPTEPAIYKIYRSCLIELIKANIIRSPENAILTVDQMIRNDTRSDILDESKCLYRISKNSKGISGRSLRKIPFLAHALLNSHGEEVPLECFLAAMAEAVYRERAGTKYFKKPQ